MDITQVPFNRFIKILFWNGQDQILGLAFDDNTKNHLGTFHAGAQFALAEAASGLALQKHFPDLEGSVVPVLRKSEVKFKKPAQSDVRARATLNAETKKRFISQLNAKGRAAIAVPVEVTDANGVITMTGRYEWFVRKL